MAQPSRRCAGGRGADLDHQWLPQVPVSQLPGLWQEKVRLHLWGDSAGLNTPCPWPGGLTARGQGPTYTDGAQVLPECQLCLLVGKEELPMPAVGWQRRWDGKKATI